MLSGITCISVSQISQLNGIFKLFTEEFRALNILLLIQIHDGLGSFNNVFISGNFNLVNS